MAQLKELQERSFDRIDPFALFIDGYHIGGAVFIVGLLIDMQGKKHVLGFWEGATENHEICIELLNNLEDRGLSLTSEVLFVIDGGKGILKALKERFGKQLIYQRCTVHKDRNIQSHLPKRYHPEAHRRFRNAIDCQQLRKDGPKMGSSNPLGSREALQNNKRVLANQRGEK